MDDDYVTAEQAAQILGVSRATIYAYVSRKGVRSQPIPGTRKHRYWRADVERLKTRASPATTPSGEVSRESEITLVSERGLFYRGENAITLSEHASFEQVAALLWNVGGADVFTSDAPRSSKIFGQLDKLLHAEAGVDRALSHFPFLEHANPRAYDLSPRGMALTGVDIVRWLTAIILNVGHASAELIHLQFARALTLPPELSDLLRRLLILAADHGMTEDTYAVRMVASTGVTPWRSVAAGLAVAVGRHSKFGQSDSLRRFVAELIAAPDPEVAVVRRIKEGQDIPGFGSQIYSSRDPRAAALLAFCDGALHGYPAFAKLRRAVDVAYEVRQLRPNFGLLSTFAEELMGLQSRRSFLGLSSSEAPYLVGRSAGWVAHCIEQHSAGETRIVDMRYRGILPASMP
jgi:citrate synthase